MKSLRLKKIRYTAAEILAAAIFETYPNVQLIGGDLSPSGFYYDFIFPHPLHPELQTQVEERMRQIIREKREVRELEMVAASAKGFLISRGHSNKATLVNGPGLFSLVQIGEFVDLASGSFLKNSSEIEHFKLFNPILLNGKRVRFSGTAFETKTLLKEFIKKFNVYSKNRHERVGEIQQFWKIFDKGIVFLPSGIEERDSLTAKLKKNILPSAIEVSCPINTNMHGELLKNLGVEAVCEILTEKHVLDPVESVGLLDPEDRRLFKATTFLNHANSLLHSIEKALKILSLDFSLVLTRSKDGGGVLEKSLESLGWSFEISEEKGANVQLDFFVADGLGRHWSAVCVTADKLLSVQVIVERNLALLLYRLG